jgi:hypothetical protein
MSQTRRRLRLSRAATELHNARLDCDWNDGKKIVSKIHPHNDICAAPGVRCRWPSRPVACPWRVGALG